MGEARASTFQPDDLLCDRFRVIRLIAHGGMGELYEATDLELGERVALKTIRPEIAGDERTQLRFRREALLARKVTHPNICRIFDLFLHAPAPGGSDTPTVFVTMELLRGETLADRLARTGRFPAEDALPIVRQMCAALAAAHAAGIVHRDFKSNNVMLLEPESPQLAPRVVVTDFGLAYRVSDSADTAAAVTRPGEFLGTPDYAAPEQLEGGEVTAATDVYALGLVVYEMVTGVRAFAAETPMASALRRLSGIPPRPIRHLSPDLPAHWDEVIARCLARQPLDRPQTAAAVAEMFDDPAVAATAAQAPRTRRVALVASLIAAVTIAGVALWRVQSPRTTESGVEPSAEVQATRPAVAVFGFRNLTGRDDAAWLGVALSEMLTTELAAGERLRTVSGENISRVKLDLALADADSYNADTLGRIHRNLRTDLLVLGSYVVIGTGADATFRVDIRLQNSSAGETLAVVSESGRVSDLFDVVSRAGGALRDRLGVDAPSAATASVRSTLPASTEAARLYSEGLLRLRQFDQLQARTLFEQSIAADPMFALAHAALARAWAALGYDGRALDASRRAFELSGGLPRADRLQVEGIYREASRAWPEAIRIWQTLATFFPDDVEYALRLANAQIASSDPNAAMATIEQFRRQFPDAADPRLSLSESRAAEVLADFQRMHSAAGAAAAMAEEQRAVQLVAAARLSEGGALLRMGQTQPGIRLIEEARGFYANAGDRGGVARATNNLAIALSNGPEAARAVSLYEEALVLARAVGDQNLVARLLNNLAIQVRRAGNLDLALRMNREALAIREEIGDRANGAVSLNNIGNLLLDLGDPEAAATHYERSAALSREVGDRAGEARARHNAAFALRELGEIVRARAAVEEGLKIRRGIADPTGVATSLYGLGAMALLHGDLKVATQSLTESLEMERRLNLRSQAAATIAELGDAVLQSGDFEKARQYFDESLKARIDSGEKVNAAKVQIGLAMLALEEGRPAETEKLAREAAAVFGTEHVQGGEATARAFVAWALAVQNRRAAAMEQLAQARRLATGSKSALVRLDVTLAGAVVDAMSNPAAALRTLEALRAEAVQRQLPKYEFQARRAMASIEGRRSPAEGNRITQQLRTDAVARGFGLYARP